MAEVSDIVFKKGVTLMTINEFRKTHGEGVKAQAISYAIEHDLIDYVDIGPRVRAIVMTGKSLSYKPNSSPKRSKMQLGK